MGNRKEDPIETVYLRLKSYLNRLETTICEIVDELEQNRQERNDWLVWHEDWKSAWLSSNGGDLPVDEEVEYLRFITSVKRRNSLFDLKKEVYDLKNELENIRCDREKLFMFLENSSLAFPVHVRNSIQLPKG